MPRVTRVAKARKSQGTCSKCGTKIKAGDPYLWWKFKVGGRRNRCAAPACAPRASDLTQSEFLGQLYDLQEQVSGCRSGDELQELADQVRDLGSEQEDKLSNMPDSLQYSPSGEMLQERADYCSEWADELESHAHEFEELQEAMDAAEDEEAVLEAEEAIENWASSIPDYPG